MDNNTQPTDSMSQLTPPNPVPTPTTKSNKRGGLKTILLLIAVVIAIAGIVYAVYATMQNTTNTANIKAKDDQIKTLNAKINTLEAPASAVVDGNVIQIRELGISITVPDSLKDLTYSYVGNDTVYLSTKTTTDKYVSTNVCSSFGVSPPLGAIAKVDGEHTGEGTNPQAPFKQFAGNYILYSAPQSGCADDAGEFTQEINAIKSAVSTVKKL